MHDPISPGKRAAFGILVAYSLAWKAASLWRAAKDDSKPWFTTLFLVNSVGILDALYIFKISPSRKKREEPEIIDGREYIQQTHPQET